ncbi:MAG: hypothetical protein ABG776_19170, partial [Cyanobacteria bacterium J06555_13]
MESFYRPPQACEGSLRGAGQLVLHLEQSCTAISLIIDTAYSVSLLQPAILPRLASLKTGIAALLFYGLLCDGEASFGVGVEQRGE